MRFLSTLAASTLGTLLALLVIGFIGFIFFAAIVASTGSSTPTVRSNSVLEVRLSGAIPEITTSDPFEELLFDQRPTYDLVGLKSAIENAATDDKIEAIWLRTQGLAASWTTLQEVRESLLEFKESGKPIIASSGESFISERDYFISSVADEIYAAPGAFFEFNGLYAQTLYFKGALDKLQVQPTIVRAGSFKSAVEPFTRTDMSDESREQLQALLSAHINVFTEAVAESRDTTEAYITSTMNEGAFIAAEDALEAELLDALMFDDDVKEKIKERIDAKGDLRTVSLSTYSSVPGSNRQGNEGTIAVVYAVGTIVTGRSSSGTVGSDTFVDAMEDVRDNDDVKAVVLRINSPGGSALASDAMWHAIDQTAQEKPVIVSMGDVAASGGYWIATAGDTIVADPATITGSIGVFGMFFSVNEMLESKLGITTDVVSTSPYADMLSGMRPLRRGEQAMLERLIDSTYTDFLDLVADSRDMTVDAVDAIAQGRVWSGQDALEIGLVDTMGGLNAAIAIAAEKAELEEGTYRLRRLPKPPSLMEQYMDLFMLRIGPALGLGKAPLNPQTVRQHLDLLEEAGLMQGTPQARMPLEFTIE